MLKIKKRTGTLVNYDGIKIIDAIENAMRETPSGIDGRVSRLVENAIALEVKQSNEDSPLTVEEIQDLVEILLTEHGRFDVAKRYVIYREERRKSRGKSKKYKLLSDEFLSKYKHQPDPFPTELGKFTFYRTYSRYIQEEGRRERWWETVARAVDYNCSLSPVTDRFEAEALFDSIYNLRQFLSGRTLFTGGTRVSKLYQCSNFNCSFSVVDSFKALRDGFYLLMVGAGFGFRVLHSDVAKLPPLRTDVEVINKQVKRVPKHSRQEVTTIAVHHNSIAEIIIGDDKMAWAESIRLLFEILTEPAYRNINTVLVNYDNIRPKGERLKTFGGYASGEGALIKIFDKIACVISESNGTVTNGRVKLKPIDVLDICNIIGVGVVSGGVRRSSEICMFDIDDTDILNAKSNLYVLQNGEWVIDENIEHRRLSNNSIYYRAKPSKEYLKASIQSVRYSGEPGVVNEVAGKKRRPNFNGTNPCFTGDMRLLTVDGYRTFEELNGKEVELVNYEGGVSKGKVWYTGNKPTVTVKFSNGTQIRCTEDHRFMLVDGSECEAKDLKGKSVLGFVHVYKNEDLEQTLDSTGSRVLDVVPTGSVEPVYDFNEPLTHWGVVEGFVVHNCGEILLDSKGLCNLTEVNVCAFVFNGKLDLNSLCEAQKMSVRAGIRINIPTLELHEWDAIAKRDNLLGCSLTGWQDMVNATGMSIEDQKVVLRTLKQVAREEALSYSKELGMAEPLLITTVKPSGSLSLLPTVSSGVHFSHSEYYVRRVRVSRHDPLAQLVIDLGYPVFPEVGQEWETCDTIVVEFPVHSPKGKTKGDVSAIEQLEIYKMFMEEYVEHNVSITVHVRDDEWDAVTDWVYDNWDDVVAVSFLSYDDSFYQLLPYESITEEAYKERLSNLPKLDISQLSKYEVGEDFEIEVSDCSSGVCSVR